MEFIYREKDIVNEQTMNRGDVIRYVDMTIAEGFSLQRGMNSR